MVSHIWVIAGSKSSQVVHMGKYSWSLLPWNAGAMVAKWLAL